MTASVVVHGAILFCLQQATIQAFVAPPPPRTNHQHSAVPIFKDSVGGNCRHQSMEANVISDVKNARTCSDIYRILRNAAVYNDSPGHGIIPMLGHNNNNNNNNNNTDEGEEQDDWQTLPTPEARVSPNIAAAALKKLVVIINQGDEEIELANQIIPRLLNNIEQATSIQQPPTLSLYALSGTISALARLSRRSSYTDATTLARTIVACLQAQLPEVTQAKETAMLVPTRLVAIMDAMVALNVVSTKVMVGIVTRLSQSGTLGQLVPSDLVRLLWCLRDYQAPLVVMVLKRLGKQAVHSKLKANEVIVVLRAAVHLSQTEFSGDANAMAYTLIRRGLIWSRGTNNETLVNQFTGGQVAIILHAIEKFDLKDCDHVMERLCERLTQQEAFENTADYELAILLSKMRHLKMNGYPQVVTSIGRRFLQRVQSGSDCMERQTIISVLRNAMHLQDHNEATMDAYLQGMIHLISDDSFLDQTTETDLATMVWFLAKAGHSDHRNHSEIMIRLGDRFRRRALDTYDFSPESFSMILRFSVLSFGYNNQVMEPFLKAAKYLILAESILVRCEEQELRDLAWFAVRAKWDDELVISAIAKRVLDSDLVDDCSSSAAYSLLSSFTTMAPRLNSDRYDKLLSQLFNVLGTHLLTNDLNQKEAADALYIYAKTCYIYDMGIFDHLATLLFSHVDECSIRDLAKSLWACGKMYSFEGEQSATENADAPPYLKFAREFATRLVQRSNELLPQDVAQSLWALGSLSIRDESIVSPLAQRAMTIAPDCNSQEIANILWGLSKVGYSRIDVVRTLSARIRSPDLSPTTQEAANILYALGRLRVDDEATFTMLSQLIMDQLDTCTAQAIANTLWAFHELGLSPPHRLLEGWASEKLGMVGFVNAAVSGKGDTGMLPEDNDVFEGVVPDVPMRKN